VSSQVRAAAQTTNAQFDLMLVYNPEAIERTIPETILAECVDPKGWPGKISLVEASGQSYYEQKNFGVRHTDGDTIILIDSDVVPDDGWLGHILEALRHPEVQVVSGETYLATDTFYDRLLAAFWIFDTKKPPRPLREVSNFYANNVAFRADILRRFPFPSADTYRGQCATLAKTLRSNGIKLHRAGAAMVSHPPPAGLSHFVNRAICHGHDIVLSRQGRRMGWLVASPIGAMLRFLKDLFSAPLRIAQRRQASVQSVSGAVIAFFLSVAYSILKFGGEVATFFSPAFVRKRFSI
jgi:hypothetical protein